MTLGVKKPVFASLGMESCKYSQKAIVSVVVVPRLLAPCVLSMLREPED